MLFKALLMLPVLLFYPAAQYTLHFDSRGVKDGPGAGAQGTAEEHPDAFSAFTFPHRPSVSPEQLLAYAGSEPGSGASDTPASSSKSGFDPKAALSGASRSPEVRQSVRLQGLVHALVLLSVSSRGAKQNFVCQLGVVLLIEWPCSSVEWAVS